jgi:glyoxylase I family protein
MVQTQGVNHVALACADLDRSVGFYTRVLEMNVIMRGCSPDGKVSYAFLGTGGETFLALYQYAHRAAPEASQGRLDHVAFSLTAEEFAQAKERLEAQGMSVSGPVVRLQFKSLYLSDPDGAVVELTQGSFQAEDQGQEVVL